VLEAFVKSFDFRRLPIEEALRTFLASFRLPGEAQIIQRILELFGSHWFASHDGAHVVASSDVAFVLAYAIIILNVDLHNPKNKNRMSLKDFLRNHRGLNANADFPPEFLEAIYVSIKTREIVMPEEQTGDLKEDYEWQVRSAPPPSISPVHKHVLPTELLLLLLLLLC
jgi:brefeldin A-resistance guanine nucleotide exchange factor 1